MYLGTFGKLGLAESTGLSVCPPKVQVGQTNRILVTLEFPQESATFIGPTFAFF